MCLIFSHFKVCRQNIYIYNVQLILRCLLAVHVYELHYSE